MEKDARHGKAKESGSGRNRHRNTLQKLGRYAQSQWKSPKPEHVSGCCPPPRHCLVCTCHSRCCKCRGCRCNGDAKPSNLLSPRHCSSKHSCMPAVAAVRCSPCATCARALCTWALPGQGTADAGKRLGQQSVSWKLSVAPVPPIRPTPAVFGWKVSVCTKAKCRGVRREG